MTNKPINIEKVFKKLKKENEFELVYNKGSAIISGDKKIKANYFLLIRRHKFVFESCDYIQDRCFNIFQKDFFIVGLVN